MAGVGRAARDWSRGISARRECRPGRAVVARQPGRQRRFWPARAIGVPTVGAEERAVHRKLLVPVLAIASFAGAVVVGGCVPVATRAPAAGGTAAAHARAAGGTAHIVDYSDNDGPRSKVILTGAIGDFGEAV